jgi:hypothetical protein
LNVFGLGWSANRVDNLVTVYVILIFALSHDCGLPSRNNARGLVGSWRRIALGFLAVVGGKLILILHEIVMRRVLGRSNRRNIALTRLGVQLIDFLFLLVNNTARLVLRRLGYCWFSWLLFVI